jgi:hypothetical protein
MMKMMKNSMKKRQMGGRSITEELLEKLTEAISALTLRVRNTMDLKAL